jgi:putative dimethyl sulfoxide reductase chaperone
MTSMGADGLMSEISAELDHALARSVICRVLAAALQRPARDTLDDLAAPRSVEALLHAALVLDGGLAGPIHEAAAACAAAPSGSLQEIDALHASLLGHTLRGRICPYETEYGGRHVFGQAQELADIAGFYLAFGLMPAGMEAGRPDHIAVEIEFMAFLSLKEAHAIERRDEEMLAVTRGAMRRFLREHVGRFGRAFASSLIREDPTGFYGRTGRLCATVLTFECGRQGVPIGPETLEVRPEEPDDVPMACGSSADLVQIGAPKAG